jgi:predicted Fe-Mo cluster-binding NifX family protein
MKIALTSRGPTLDDEVEDHFGRGAYFLIVDLNTIEVEAIRNPYLALSDGIGTKSAQLVAAKGVPVVLTGNCGPNAIKIFDSAGITVMTGISGKVRHVLKRFKEGTLSYATGASVQNHFAVGKATKPDRAK